MEIEQGPTGWHRFWIFWRTFPLFWGLTCLIYGSVLVFFALALHQNDWFYFINLSPYFTTGDPNAPQGYDGQFSYFIALDPLYGIPVVTERAYRTQRILYPFIAHVMAFGRSDWVPITLVATNLLMLAGGTTVFALLLKQSKARSWLPIIFLAWVGLAQALLYDLNEITAITFALWGYYFVGEKYRVSGILFGLGALGKDIAFLFSAPAVLKLLLERKWREAIQLGALAVLPYLGWMIVLRMLYGAWSFDTAATHFEFFPFGGLYNAKESLPFVILLLILPPVVALILAQRPWHDLYVLATLASLLFLMFLPHHSYQTAAVYRVNSSVVVATSLLLARSGQQRLLTVFGALWATTSVMVWLLVLQPT